MKKNKELIHKASLTLQQDLIDNFSSRLKILEADAAHRSSMASQTENRSASKAELINNLGKELNFAQREMFFLNNLDPLKTSDTVEPGAVVVTNKLTFYISASIERFDVDGNEFFGISVKAPIYAEMAGLKKGAMFKYNETEYEILDIF